MRHLSLPFTTPTHPAPSPRPPRPTNHQTVTHSNRVASQKTSLTTTNPPAPRPTTFPSPTRPTPIPHKQHPQHPREQNHTTPLPEPQQKSLSSEPPNTPTERPQGRSPAPDTTTESDERALPPPHSALVVGEAHSGASRRSVSGRVNGQGHGAGSAHAPTSLDRVAGGAPHGFQAVGSLEGHNDERRGGKLRLRARIAQSEGASRLGRSLQGRSCRGTRGTSRLRPPARRGWPRRPLRGRPRWRRSWRRCAGPGRWSRTGGR